MTIERIPLPRGGGFPLERTQDITASVMGALFGVHPFISVLELYARHRGADLPDKEQTTIMRRGIELEPLVARMIRKRHRGWRVNRNKDYFRDPEARIGATPDFFIDGDERGPGVLQIKTVGSFVFRREYTDDNPPFWIALQNQTELMLTGARWGLIAPLVVGDFAWDLKEYEVPHHDAAQRKIRQTVADFWQAVAECRQPSPDYERDSPIIDALYPHEAPGKVIDLRSDNRFLYLLDRVERYRRLNTLRKAKLEQLEAEIKAKMGDAEIAMARGFAVTWKERQRKSYVVPAGSYRQLTVKREKQHEYTSRQV